MKFLTVSATINAPLETAWQSYTAPEHIMRWNHASDDWHCPASSNDLRVGGKFSSTMAAKDGSMQFDFWGEYTGVNAPHSLDYTLGDGRKATVRFEANGNQTNVVVNFEPEGTHPEEMQQGGWQAILENYRKHTESLV